MPRRLSSRQTNVLILFGIVMIGCCVSAIYMVLASGYGFDLPGGFRPPNSSAFRRAAGFAAMGSIFASLFAMLSVARFGSGLRRYAAIALALVVATAICWVVIGEPDNRDRTTGTELFAIECMAPHWGHLASASLLSSPKRRASA